MAVRHLGFYVTISFIDVRFREQYLELRKDLEVFTKTLAESYSNGVVSPDIDVECFESAGRLEDGSLVEPEVDEVD